LTPLYPAFLLPSALLFEKFHFVAWDDLNQLHITSVSFPFIQHIAQSFAVNNNRTQQLGTFVTHRCKKTSAIALFSAYYDLGSITLDRTA